jgi:hypothetical protein
MAFEGCEYLSVGRASSHAVAILGAMHQASRMPGQATASYTGDHRWLMLWGVGREEHAQAWRAHSGPVVMWDLGYFGRAKRDGYYRVSVDHWHPTPEQIERTRPDPERWDRFGVPLREDGDTAGPIVLVGMGPKSHAFTGDVGWEQRTLQRLRERFPGRRIEYRAKPGKPAARLDCARSAAGSIEEAIRGASLVVCRHSNAAVDAVVAGVPVECEDGAARWLQGRAYTAATRLDFLRRLAWWQWRVDEAAQAWQFLRKVTR